MQINLEVKLLNFWTKVVINSHYTNWQIQRILGREDFLHSFYYTQFITKLSNAILFWNVCFYQFINFEKFNDYFLGFILLPVLPCLKEVRVWDFYSQIIAPSGSGVPWLSHIRGLHGISLSIWAPFSLTRNISTVWN